MKKHPLTTHVHPLAPTLTPLFHIPTLKHSNAQKKPNNHIPLRKPLHYIHCTISHSTSRTTTRHHITQPTKLSSHPHQAHFTLPPILHSRLTLNSTTSLFSTQGTLRMILLIDVTVHPQSGSQRICTLRSALYQENEQISYNQQY